MPAKFPLEKVAEQDVTDKAVANGWTVRKLTFLGVNGAPDRIFGKDGRTVCIEFKRKGKVPTKQQEKRHEELRFSFGWQVEWTDSYAEGCRILGIKE